MNVFKVTIQFYEGEDKVFNKQTKWERPDRLAKHYMAKLDKQGIMWRTLTVEWEGK